MKRLRDDEASDELLPVLSDEYHAPSEMEQFLCSGVHGVTIEEKLIAFTLEHRNEQGVASVWPVVPPSGASLLFCPIKSGMRHKARGGRMMSSTTLDDVEEEQEEAQVKPQSVWVPCGEGSLRTTDGRLFFSLVHSDLPSLYCRQAFPGLSCAGGFAPCIPVGHRSRGRIAVTRLTARKSHCEGMELKLAIVKGGCRPLFCAMVELDGRIMLEMRHSQPGHLLEQVMQELLRERTVPHLISNNLAAVFFGLTVERVWKQLEHASEARRKY